MNFCVSRVKEMYMTELRSNSLSYELKALNADLNGVADDELGMWQTLLFASLISSSMERSGEEGRHVRPIDVLDGVGAVAIPESSSSRLLAYAGVICGDKFTYLDPELPAVEAVAILRAVGDYALRLLNECPSCGK
jgi:hypothetical protein